MLADAVPRAFDHAVPRIRLHQQAHQRFLRDGLAHQGAHAIPLAFREDPLRKTRAVMIVHRGDPHRRPRGRLRRRVHGEVAAFGMPSEHERRADAFGDLVDVAARRLLRGDGRRVRHVEIFLPPHPGAIGAAEGEVGEQPGAGERHRGELGLLRLVVHAGVIMDDDVAEPRAGGHRQQQLLHLLGNEAREHVVVALGAQQIRETAPAHLRPREALHGPPHAHRPAPVLLVERRQSRHAHHGQLREHERVDLAQGLLAEGGELRRRIVHDARHAVRLLARAPPGAS